jgi:hypothetical protein
MKRVLKTFVISGLIVSLSGCLYGQCLDGPCAFERAKMIESIKPYGSHWIKDGMCHSPKPLDIFHSAVRLVRQSSALFCSSFL